MEGNHCYPPGSSCSPAGLIVPITEYPHDPSGGQAIIGGFVYHGSAIAGLTGTYVFGDLSSGHVWTLTQDGPGNWQRTLVLTHGLTVSSFGQDAAGELYLLNYGDGAILQVRAAPFSRLQRNEHRLGSPRRVAEQSLRGLGGLVRMQSHLLAHAALRIFLALEVFARIDRNHATS